MWVHASTGVRAEHAYARVARVSHAYSGNTSRHSHWIVQRARITQSDPRDNEFFFFPPRPLDLFCGYVFISVQQNVPLLQLVKVIFASVNGG